MPSGFEWTSLNPPLFPRHIYQKCQLRFLASCGKDVNKQHLTVILDTRKIEEHRVDLIKDGLL